MSAFLYFIPKQVTVAAEDLARVGITAIESLESVGFCRVERGPDGGPGVVFAVQLETDAGKMPKIGHYPEDQAWQVCNGDRFWIGYEKDNKPSPADLQRGNLIAGHEIELDDGDSWTVPVARSFGMGSGLPQSLMLGPGGELVSEGLPQFAQLGQQAERVFEAFLNDGDQLTIQDCWNIAIEALAANYRVSGWEVSALRLLNTDNVQTVLGHLIDLPVILEAARAESEKKRASESGSLNDGTED